MTDTIYLVDGDSLTPLKPSAPPNEDSLQDLIARHGDLIGDDDGELLLVQRETAVADSQDGAGRWPIDHLFLTRDAIPVLVEVKRAVDTRLRREVVGQLLDYAANGSAYWTAADAARSFAETCRLKNISADDALAEFLAGAAEPDGFWDRVESNLRDGHLKMLIVADRIPRELTRIVEFLNDQMRAEVLAIELRYFESDDQRLMLSPRTIGNTERASAKKRRGGRRERIGIDAWLERDIAPQGDAVMVGARKWLDIMHELGVDTGVAVNHGSIVASFESPEGRKRYPLRMASPGRGHIEFRWVSALPGTASEEIRQSFLERFAAAVGPLSTDNARGSPSFPIERLNDRSKAEAFARAAADWFEAVGYTHEDV